MSVLRNIKGCSWATRPTGLFPVSSVLTMFTIFSRLYLEIELVCYCKAFFDVMDSICGYHFLKLIMSRDDDYTVMDGVEDFPDTFNGPIEFLLRSMHIQTTMAVPTGFATVSTSASALCLGPWGLLSGVRPLAVSLSDAHVSS